MKLTGNIIFLGCEDLNRIRNTYGGFLGFPLEKDQGKCLIYSMPGGGMLGFCEHLSKCDQEKSPIVTLLCDSREEVEKTHQEFAEESVVELESSPELNPDFNLYHFFARDPEGYLLEVQTFLD